MISFHPLPQKNLFLCIYFYFLICSDPGIGFVASSTRSNPQFSTAATTRSHTGEGRPTGLRRPQDTPRRVIFDSNDIAVKVN